MDKLLTKEDKEYIQLEMSEYVKSTSIAFAEWIYENRIRCDISQAAHNEYQYFYVDGEGAAKNTEDLYQLFLTQ